MRGRLACSGQSPSNNKDRYLLGRSSRIAPAKDSRATVAPACSRHTCNRESNKGGGAFPFYLVQHGESIYRGCIGKAASFWSWSWGRVPASYHQVIEIGEGKFAGRRERNLD